MYPPDKCPLAPSVWVLESGNACVKLSDHLILGDPLRTWLGLDPCLLFCSRGHDRSSWMSKLILVASGSNHSEMEDWERMSGWSAESHK